MEVVRALAVVRRRQEYVQVESVAREAANGAAGMSGQDHNILSYLSLLQHKIDSIIANYVGVNNIISIIDLERELVRILDIFCFNSIDYTIALMNSNKTKKCESIVNDPNEIELDATVDNGDSSSSKEAVFIVENGKKSKSFIDFGLGCICKHPVILRLYQLNIQSCVLCDKNHGDPAFIPSNKVIEFVHSYYMNECVTKQLHFDITSFTEKLCQNLQIGGLNNVGIIIKDNFFTNDLVMLKLAIESNMRRKKIALNQVDNREHSVGITGVKRGAPDIDDHVHLRTYFESKIPKYNNAKPTNIITIKTATLVNYVPAPLCLDLTTSDANKAVGKWGESLVYQYLLSIAHLSQSKVQWVNEDVESKACYDLIVTTPIKKDSDSDAATRYTTTYIEVKSTKYSDANVFELSLWEWEFAMANPKVPYHIYRVYNAGDANNVRVEIITDIQQMIVDGSIKLCLAIV